MTVIPSIQEHNDLVASCCACPRLVAWRENVATEKVKRFMDWHYWGKAVPSFGLPDAELLIVGLAPAAHGANRTGRMFTGDRSGDWLYRAMHKAGFATQAESVSRDDGLTLINSRITAVCHCAPPANKPDKTEILNCRPYFYSEILGMPNLKVIIALGKLAYDTVQKVVYTELPALDDDFKKQINLPSRHKSTKTKFSHLAIDNLPVSNGMVLIGSYHPSQQNTFTGKLTEPMFDAVFDKAKQYLN